MSSMPAGLFETVALGIARGPAAVEQAPKPLTRRNVIIHLMHFMTSPEEGRLTLNAPTLSAFVIVARTNSTPVVDVQSQNGGHFARNSGARLPIDCPDIEM